MTQNIKWHDSMTVRMDSQLRVYIKWHAISLLNLINRVQWHKVKELKSKGCTTNFYWKNNLVLDKKESNRKLKCQLKMCRIEWLLAKLNLVVIKNSLPCCWAKIRESLHKVFRI
jgi:hypothetical protein